MFNYKFNSKIEERLMDAKSITPTTFDEALLERFNPNLQKEILNFINTALRKFPEVDLSLFYQNLSTLKIRTMKEDDFNYGLATCYYRSDLNKIVCRAERVDALYWGFLIAASSITNEGKNMNGFYQTDGNRITGLSIGSSLNNGYTSMLGNMLFRDKEQYVNEKYLAQNLFKTMGRKMNQYYFGADLKGFISSMERFHSREETINFIQKMDYISKKLNSLTFMLHKKECLDLYYECIIFTIGAFITKLRQDLENGVISVYNAQLRLNMFFSNIPKNAIIWCKHTPIPHIEELQDAPNIAHININDIARYRLTK